MDLNFLSPLEKFFFFMYFLNFFMKRATSLTSHSELSSYYSSSSLELSTTTYLFLLFLLALKAISWFLVLVMPLERFLTWLTSSIYISWFMTSSCRRDLDRSRPPHCSSLACMPSSCARSTCDRSTSWTSMPLSC
jgi:hypothetical protein